MRLLDDVAEAGGALGTAIPPAFASSPSSLAARRSAARFTWLAARVMYEKSGTLSCADVGIRAGTIPRTNHVLSTISCSVGRALGSGVRIA